ncbi:MAG TPA: T9SS type A sorting domain-containing protein, partial [Chitinophagales bacterium]|nr:T9SS type A sorting domain-containing protein [Chitinophagales bacterium]
VVRTLDCTQYIADTIIDIWHANDAGQYDNTGFNLRGKTMTNAQGFYSFETVLPGKYLNGGEYRPRHIHFKITPTGFPTLTTQLYFTGDTSIPSDAAASVTTGAYDATHRIITLTPNTDGKLEGTWDIVVDGDGTATGLHDIYLDKGMIYAVFPNPADDTMRIQYGVFQQAKASLSVYDMKGSLVAVLDEQELAPQKYTAEWKTPAGMAPGIYWVALKINDLQVHYQKVVKQ